MNQQQLMEDDLLDFVDKMLEVLGKKTSAAVDVRILDNCCPVPQVLVVPWFGPSAVWRPSRWRRRRRNSGAVAAEVGGDSASSWLGWTLSSIWF